MSAGAFESGTSQLSIVATDDVGHNIIGKNVELRQNGTLVANGFIPHTFTVRNSLEYQVGVADYHHYIFNHWADTGSTDRWRSVTLTKDTTLNAVYKITVDNNVAAGSSQGSSAGSSTTGTGGRGLTKAVIITTPENGEPVSPAGFQVSGITIGNPTTVEIAVRDPLTDVKTPYLAVNPDNPGDFTRWSYSLAISNLAMTQVDVRALFSDGSQETASVSVYYYTAESGTSTDGNLGSVKVVKLQSSIRIADASRPMLRVVNIADSLHFAAAAQAMPAAGTDVADKDRSSTGINNSGSDSSSWPLALEIAIILGLVAFFVWFFARKRKVLVH
jgi:hypothetical protein